MRKATNANNAKTKTFLKTFTVLSLGATLVALSGCGSTDPIKNGDAAAGDAGDAQQSEPSTPASLSGSIAGAGASSQEAAMNAWRAGFQTSNPDLTITYDAVGSGAGIGQFLSGQVVWAGSDEALQAEELEESKNVCAGQTAFNIPAYVSPIAVVFNLEGVKNINLSAGQIADIFNDKITKWNDPSITAANPDVTLPDLKITTVHRADKSGTTENFTAYLAEAAEENWPHKPSKEWPVASGESGDKTSGVIQVVSGGQGTIGYADASQAGSLGTVAIQVGESYTKYSAEAAGKAVETAEVEAGRAAGDLALKLDRKSTTAGVYPLVLVSYLIACPKYDDAATVENLKSFMKYIVSPAGQQVAGQAAGSAPLPASMAEKALASIETISAK